MKSAQLTREQIERRLFFVRLLNILTLLHFLYCLIVLAAVIPGFEDGVSRLFPGLLRVLGSPFALVTKGPTMSGLVFFGAGVAQVVSTFNGKMSLVAMLEALAMLPYSYVAPLIVPDITRRMGLDFVCVYVLGFLVAGLGYALEGFRNDTLRKAAMLGPAPQQPQQVQSPRTPVTTRGVYRRNPAAFDRLVGVEHAIERIKTALERPLLEPELAKKYKIVPPKGILLYGPAGTGKTSLAKATAEYFNCTFIDASVGLLSPLVGEAEKNLSAVFAYARQHAPSIIWFDEIDKIGRKRDSSNLNRPSDLLLPVLLTEMDGFEPNTGVLVMAATNRPDTLDEALLRAGRFDCKIYVPLPDTAAREKLFRLFLQGVPLAPDFNYEIAAEMTKGASPATIEKAINEAKNYAASRESAGLGRGVTLADIEAGLAMVTTGIVGGENDGS